MQQTKNKISPSKINRLMKLYLSGCTQAEIANKLHIHQSTVSHYVSILSYQYEQKEIANTYEEAEIMETIQTLHLLAAELKAAKLSAEEARTGIKVMSKLKQYGVDEEQYQALVQATKQMYDQGYINGAVKLADLEKVTGKSYGEITGQFDILATEFTSKSQLVEQMKLAVTKINDEIGHLMMQKNGAEEKYQTYLNETGMTTDRLKAVEKLALVLKGKSITDAQVDDYVSRQEILDKMSLSLKRFVEIVSVCGVMTSADNGAKLLKYLTESEGLFKLNNILKSKKAGLENQAAGWEQKIAEKKKAQAEIENLKLEKVTLTEQVEKLSSETKDLEQLKAEVSSLKFSKKGLQADLGAMESRKTELGQEIAEAESHHAQLEPLEIKYNLMTEGVQEKEEAIQGQGILMDYFKAFLEFTKGNTAGTLQTFMSNAPYMVSWAKTQKFPLDSIKEMIFSDLTRGRLNYYTCSQCQTIFSVHEAPSFKDKYKCPNCNTDTFVQVNKHACETFKKMVNNEMNKTHQANQPPAESQPQGIKIILIDKPGPSQNTVPGSSNDSITETHTN